MPFAFLIGRTYLNFGGAMSGPDKESSKQAQFDSALLIIDLISDFEFEDGDKLFPQALAAADNVARLKAKAKKSAMPVIYVNDNYGRWNDDFSAYKKFIREGSEKGRKLLDLIEPEPDDYFILKPQRSGFYATALGVLLLSMNVSTVIVTGVTSDICVLFTAHDAYMRGFHVRVPGDCSAAVERRYHDEAMNLLARVADADTGESSGIRFSEIHDRRGNSAARNDPPVSGVTASMRIGGM
jgi:nicotinamidase-related amidase